MRLIRSLALVPALIALTAGPAFAGVVTLRDNPVDDDGRITLGELFEGAGAAADVVVARRSGPTAVLEAGQLQALARQSGLQWSNPSGLRRIMVREGAVAADSLGRPAASVAARPGATAEVLTYARSLAAGDVVQPEDVIWSTVQSHMAPAGAPQDADQVIGLSARRALRAGAPVASRDLASPQVIARNDMVQVEFAVAGVNLTVTGRATRNAALGEATPILNVQSGRTIDAVAVGPGRAVAGPAAVAARAHPTQFAAR
ncbi:MAG: flagellar basal body P-ring formation protein FlgA [Brevundimonas sp.]|uniref:flagellar basal body P-ring formation chaperone FlgA n=1 Tax=Brevundimonas sp. TaxID=1871086 RepID=UPI0011F9F534|nr:flagellar basal body P-ring formation chaperone FlgA [Brevundimonas sp.]RZJ18110.1 MAG: flagellar basal body P-ring formation protein FlgA [Brevundimonas sp.]